MGGYGLGECSKVGREGVRMCGMRTTISLKKR